MRSPRQSDVECVDLRMASLWKPCQSNGLDYTVVTSIPKSHCRDTSSCCHADSGGVSSYYTPRVDGISILSQASVIISETGNNATLPSMGAILRGM